jgi:hypothetical protein
MRIAILVLAAASLAEGRQEEPVFRAGTKLVELTVGVLDKKGNGVASLVLDAPNTARAYTGLEQGDPSEHAPSPNPLDCLQLACRRRAGPDT